jgi:hypothetical protein
MGIATIVIGKAVLRVEFNGLCKIPDGRFVAFGVLVDAATIEVSLCIIRRKPNRLISSS